MQPTNQTAERSKCPSNFGRFHFQLKKSQPIISDNIWCHDTKLIKKGRTLA